MVDSFRQESSMGRGSLKLSVHKRGGFCFQVVIYSELFSDCSRGQLHFQVVIVAVLLYASNGCAGGVYLGCVNSVGCSCAGFGNVLIVHFCCFLANRSDVSESDGYLSLGISNIDLFFMRGVSWER